MVTNTEINVCEETQVKPVTTEQAAAITEEDFLKAQKLFQQGKKNLILNKYDEATNNIADACKIYSTKYGELNYNCAELYFYYGKALLELSRVENTVLGNALTGVPEESEPINDSRYGNPDQVPEEEREEIFDKVIDAMCPEETPNDQPATEPTTEATKVEEEKPKEESTSGESVVTPKEDAKETEKKEDENGQEEGEEEGEEEEEGDDVDVEEGANGEKKEGGEEEDEDDVTNLQQSWEMFELAKVIYNKQIDSIQDNDEKIKVKIRIGECLLKLGEIGIEQELFEQAINDLKESIKLQEELNVNERDERLLAESYYQLTLAYQFNNEFDLAKESHKKSTNILDIRIEKLRAKLTDTNLSESEKSEINDEIQELEKLLPEMILKLEEINEQNEKQLNLIKEAKECFLSEKPSTTTTATTASAENGNGGEVKDITELIKSKRKLSTDKLDTNAKKTKVDEDGTESIQVEEQQNGATVASEEKPMETTTTPVDVEPTATTTTTSVAE